MSLHAVGIMSCLGAPHSPTYAGKLQMLAPTSCGLAPATPVQVIVITAPLVFFRRAPNGEDHIQPPGSSGNEHVGGEAVAPGVGLAEAPEAERGVALLPGQARQRRRQGL